MENNTICIKVELDSKKIKSILDKSSFKVYYTRKHWKRQDRTKYT